MTTTAPRRPKFVEEVKLATRSPQRQLPIRQSEWDQLRRLLERCKTRERSFAGGFWSAISIGATALFSTVGFTLVQKTPEWIMRTSISVTVSSVLLAVVLGFVDRMFKKDKTASVEDALLYMQTCQDGFLQDAPNE